MTTLFDPPRNPGEIKLRPYQEQAASAVDAARARGLRSGLIVLATGGGKTTIFSHLIGQEAKRGGRSLILAHRDELVEQAADRISSMTDVRVDIEGGDRKAIGTAEAVVASVQTIGRAGSSRLGWLRPTLIVTDECHHACFVAGTLIDGRPIEKLRIGDSIKAYDHCRDEVTDSHVSAVMRREPTGLLRIVFENGATLVCTPNHPIYGSKDGKSFTYVSAGRFKVGDAALFTTNEREHTKEELHQAEDLRDLRDGVPTEKLEPDDGAVLLGRVQGDGAGSPEEADNAALPEVRGARHLNGQAVAGLVQAGTRVLLHPMQERVLAGGKFGQDGGHQSEACERTNEDQQPCFSARCAGEDLSSQEGASAEGTGWQWLADGSADEVSGGTWAPDGIHGPDCGGCEPIHGSAAPGVQDRHRRPGQDAGDRGGRERALCVQGEGQGRVKDPRLECTRVASVEVLEPGSDGRFGGLCPDGFVYNLSVNTHHNYYANGILVHNCAETYQSVYRRFPCEFHLGVTATAHRMDNRPLHGGEAIYEAVLFEYGIKPMIMDGWLCDIRAYRCDASYSLQGVKTTAGDYNQKDLDKRVNTNRNNLEALAYWAKVATGRRTIVFCTSVDHAHAMANLFVDQGIVAEAVDGTMDKGLRAGIMSRFKSGETQVLCNMNIATEGFDCPEASCVLLLRPTKSWSLFVQMVGRGLRTAPGKDDCIIIDVEGAGDDKSLASVPGVLGLPQTASQKGDSFKQLAMRIDALPDDLRARLGRRPFDLESLDSVLAEVDLLRDLGPSEEIVSGSDWAWQTVADGWYSLWCGSDETKTKTRKATLRSDVLGTWTLDLIEGDGLPVSDVVFEGIDPAKALHAADNAIRRAWPGLDGFLRRDAPWRNKTGGASEKQKFWLKKFGLTDAEIAQMTRSEVSTFLDRKFSKKRR